MASLPSVKSKSLEASLYLFHHVFFPPKLPQSEYYKPEYELLLLDQVINALRNFSGHVPSQDAGILTTVTTIVSHLRDICDFDGDVNEAKLTKALAQLDIKGKHVRRRHLPSYLTGVHVASFLYMCVIRTLEF